MIVAENISKDFNGVKAVNDISFEVKEGSTLVLLGTSGCGKTTTLKMLNRLIEPASGRILIDGRDVLLARPELLRRSMGYVSQNNGLFPHFTVSENIAIVPRLLGWSKDKISERSSKLLAQLYLPLDSFGHKYPDELSGGQQQRVALARALVSDPAVLLMDEPFGALDPITRMGIRKDFLELPELKRKTIVLVTHDVQEAFELGDQICLMDKGNIVQKGTPEDLIFRPENDFAKTFFGQHRLQLGYKSVKLGSVWQLLPDAGLLATATLTGGQSLWEGMEMLSETNQGTLVVSDQARSGLKEVSLSLIQSVYQQIKQKK